MKRIKKETANEVATLIAKQGTEDKRRVVGSIRRDLYQLWDLYGKIAVTGCEILTPESIGFEKQTGNIVFAWPDLRCELPRNC